jgi:EAL domain-containing protein (putative c-di-GMP-specific phosphodiesterase class I)
MKPQIVSGSVPRLSEVRPFFQPIISLQTQRIIGYEVLGRRINGQHVTSLGPFFHNKKLKETTHSRIDRHLRAMAMSRLAEAGADAGQLFINVRPSWIHRSFRDNRTPMTLELVRRKQIDPSRIVIEIMEDEVAGEAEQFMRMIQMYKSCGCTIAVDDVGAGFSNFDRIALVEPNIIKIDLHLLRQSSRFSGYEAILRSFSILASQIGASLLMEGIETREDLATAIRMGARYVQGYLFSPAVPDFLPPDVFQRLIDDELRSFTSGELAKSALSFRLEKLLNELMSGLLPDLKHLDADRLLGTLAAHVPQECIRMYVCMENGRQISSNFLRGPDGAWRRDPNKQNNNWIWRPYFIPSITLMKQRRQGMLSSVYKDLDSTDLVQTYSCPIDDSRFIFLDLMA